MSTHYLRPAKADMLRQVYSHFAANANKPLEIKHSPIKAESTRQCGELIPGVTLYTGKLNTHWGHFITEVLSNLWPLFGPERIKADHILLEFAHGDITGNIRQAFELAGVLDRIMPYDEGHSYERILSCTPAVMPGEYFADRSLAVYEAIRRAALSRPCNADKPKRIYLSRARLRKARANERGMMWLERYFHRAGYSVVYPERITLTELIHMLDGAEHVVAPSGTLPHNMLFAPQGARLSILEKYADINNFQPGIDLLRKLQCQWVDASTLIRSVDPGAGPFIMCPTEQMRHWAADNHLPPLPAYTSWQAWRDAAFFERRYRRLYGRRWILPQWMEHEVPLLREAYCDSLQHYAECLEPHPVIKKILRILGK